MRLCLSTALFIGFAGPTLSQAMYLETVCATSTREGSMTYCDRGLEFDMTVAGTSDIMAIRLTAPSGHCSPVTYFLATPPVPLPPGTAGAIPATPERPFQAGTNVLGMTGTLQPGQGEMIEIGRNWARGSHRLMVMVIGHVADCNVGQIQSWGVNVEQMIIPE